MSRVESAHKSPTGINYSQNSGTRGVIIEEPVQLGLGVSLELLLPRVVFRDKALIEKQEDHIVIGPIGGRRDYLTVTFKPELQIVTGCFCGSIEDFETELQEKEGTSKQEYEWALDFIRKLQVTRGRNDVHATPVGD